MSDYWGIFFCIILRFKCILIRIKGVKIFQSGLFIEYSDRFCLIVKLNLLFWYGETSFVCFVGSGLPLDCLHKACIATRKSYKGTDINDDFKSALWRWKLKKKVFVVRWEFIQPLKTSSIDQIYVHRDLHFDHSHFRNWCNIETWDTQTKTVPSLSDIIFH